MNLFLLLTALLGALTGSGRSVEVRAPVSVERAVAVAVAGVAAAVGIAATPTAAWRAHGHAFGSPAPRAMTGIAGLSRFAAVAAPERRRE